MMTFNYITYDAWWDTDKTIIPHLLKDYEVNVYVLTPKNHPKYNHKEIENVNLFVDTVFPYRDRDIRSAWFAIKYFYKLHSTVKRKGCVNYFVLGQNWYLLLMILFFLSSKNTIICLHNFDEHQDGDQRRFSPMTIVKNAFFRKFLCFHFHSRRQHELYQNKWGKNSFYTAMPLKDFGLPKKCHDNNKIYLLFFGMVRGYKRLDLLIEAMNMVSSDKLKVIIAGKCDNPEKYTKMMNDDKKFDCHFSFIDDNEVANYFIESDFLVLPYNDATQSGPSLIAINYGIPIISSDVEAFCDIVKDGYNGFTFKNGSAFSLAKVLAKVEKMQLEEIELLKRNQTAFKMEYMKQNDIANKFSTFINDYIII